MAVIDRWLLWVMATFSRIRRFFASLSRLANIFHLPVANRHHVDGDATAIVDHGDGVVDVNDDLYPFRIARESFVDGVIYDFIDEVVQAHFTGRTDVHGGPKPYGLQAFQNFDVFAGVIAVVGDVVSCKSRHRVPSRDFRFSGPRRCRAER